MRAGSPFQRAGAAALKALSPYLTLLSLTSCFVPVEYLLLRQVGHELWRKDLNTLLEQLSLVDLQADQREDGQYEHTEDHHIPETTDSLKQRVHERFQACGGRGGMENPMSDQTCPHKVYQC